MEKEQLIQIAIPVTVSLIVAFVIWGFRTFGSRFVGWNNGRKIYQWLKANTCDEPSKGHKSLLEISTGVRLSTERVQEACLQTKKIFQSIGKLGNYSIWRVEPLEIVQLFI